MSYIGNQTSYLAGDQNIRTESHSAERFEGYHGHRIDHQIYAQGYYQHPYDNQNHAQSYNHGNRS